MSRTLLFSLALLAGTTGSALAQDAGTFNAWGHTFNVPAWQSSTTRLSEITLTTGSLSPGAYQYAGSHAGGPADALISNGTPQAVQHRVTAPAYRYSGSHAGGPANGLSRD
ncbi:hypothetical protein OPKNFCMD_6710 [Methylobacterium crusticola]|uniref:Uncharacterized protein n=1 Tax=Methylobacterium crusticola TaxID=1697972 RepID=A0ABQ4RAY2_9HYPH|nr:hypothetical protein [Methylobacterium crusticola]GJD53931.1 hypothetical protein OPKNFCMD_6710 [Methylobacterium crusticola]